MAVTPDPGDFGLTSIVGGVGRAIRLGQWLLGDGWSAYQHAFIYLGDGLILEAEPGGARVADLAQYDGRPMLWSTGRIPLTPEHRQRIHDLALDMRGVPYSFSDYASLALHRLHVPAPHLRAYIRSSGHMICSQLVDRAYEMAGIHLFDDGRWEGDVTPGDLARLLMSVPVAT
jgi:cell wall-associated NlpC family hydrolase